MLSTPLCTSELLLVWLCPLPEAWRPQLGAELLAVPEPVCVPARISRCQVEDLLLELLGVDIVAQGLMRNLLNATGQLSSNGGETARIVTLALSRKWVQDSAGRSGDWASIVTKGGRHSAPRKTSIGTA